MAEFRPDHVDQKGAPWFGPYANGENMVSPETRPKAAVSELDAIATRLEAIGWTGHCYWILRSQRRTPKGHDELKKLVLLCYFQQIQARILLRKCPLLLW